MDIKHVLNMTAGMLVVLGFIPYFISIMRHRIMPSIVTWVIWATVDIIVLAGMFTENTLNAQIVGATFCACVVVVLSVFYGEYYWSKYDKYCLVGAALGITIWSISGSALAGIVINSAVNFVGSIPTFSSALKNPDNEDGFAWTVWILSSIANMAAIPTWTLAYATQPVTFFTIMLVMMYLLYAHPVVLDLTYRDCNDDCNDHCDCCDMALATHR